VQLELFLLLSFIPPLTVKTLSPAEKMRGPLIIRHRRSHALTIRLEPKSHGALEREYPLDARTKPCGC
jgi:hypothetical protein